MKILQYGVTSVLPQALPVFTFISKFIGTIDLDITSNLDGVVLGDIALSNTGLGSIDATNFYFNKVDEPMTITFTPTSGLTSGTFTLDFSNINYGLNFSSSWDLVFKPSDIAKYVVPELSFHLITYPNLLWTKVNASSDQITGQSFSSPTLTLGQPTSSSKSTADFASLPIIISSFMVIVLITKKRKLL